MTINDIEPINSNPFWLNLLPGFLQTRLKGRQNLFAVLHNSGWLVFDKMMRGLLSLLVGAWVARHLGPSQYGQLAYVLAFIAFFQAVANLGLDGIVVRDIARFQYLQQNKNTITTETNIAFNSIGELLGTTFTMRLLAGLFCWFLAIIIMSVTEGVNSQSVYLTALAGGSLVFQAADTVDLWFQSQTQSRRTVLAKMFAYIISNGLRVMFIVFNLPLLYFAFALFIEFALSAIALYYSYTRFTCGNQWISQIKNIGKVLLKESWPFIVSGLSIAVYMRIDQIMVKNILGDKATGIYSAVLPLVTLWYFIPSILCLSLMPTISKKKIQSEIQYLTTLRNIYIFFFSLSLLISIGIMLLAFPMTNFILGKNYLAGANVLAIYGFSNVMVFLGVAHGLWIINNGKPMMQLYRTLAGCIATFIACLFLIKSNGIIGAAWAGLVGYFISDIVAPVLLNKPLFISLFFIKNK